jgi:hypothetical protein
MDEVANTQEILARKPVTKYHLANSVLVATGF